MSVTPSSGATYVGWANSFYLTYGNNNGPVSVGATNVATTFGTFTANAAPNPNVSHVYYAGSADDRRPDDYVDILRTLTNPSSNVFDLNFSSNSSGPGTTS